ncbi:organic cation transporter protein isoform X2 [Anoplophora glabripennis]|nr:organic cation transporter protein isoform X2 [Anoplophora glabripennis]XP_018566488.1 organic cation transporter protein isoform X2 [Anoplophora glabripennis]
MDRQRMLDFDDMLEELGELGKFQIYTYILVCLPVLFAAANSLSYVFTAGVPDYRCFIPECEDPLDTSYDTPWLKWAIPAEKNSDQVIGVKADTCDRFSLNQSAINTTCSPEMFTKTIEKCSEWIFDNNERTIVNDWNITCVENQWKLSLVGTSHFAGIIVGSCVFGILADWYGRKSIFVICTLLMSISGAVQVVSPEYITFVSLIFINALGTAGVYPLAFIIGVEMVGKRKREVTGIVLNYFYALGEAIVSPIAWYTKDWVHLQLIVSVPAVLFAGYYWIVPESVRWLLANEKNDKAKKIVFKVAKFNNVVLSDNLVDSFKEEAPLTVKGEPDLKEKDKILPVIKRMLTSRKLILRFLIMYFIWAVNAFIYYGLSINSTSLGGNKYLNFALVSLIEIPGYTAAWVCIQKLGRRISLVGSLLICGVTCTLTIFIANSSSGSWAVITLFLLGKLGVTSSFGVVYVYTAELLPTVIRSGGVGTASTVARLGALLAPFVPLLGLHYAPLPMLLFGGVAILAGLLALYLPETFGIKLPETAEEAEQI